MIKRPHVILALLTALNFVNYIDRFELAAVLPKVIEELHLSKFVAGILATVFIASFLVTAPIFGWLGDRTSRTRLLAVGALLWGAATIGSGLAGTAGHLLAARALVGIGEASFTTLAPTVIYDIATERSRGKWLSIFHLGAPIGAALGYILGGAIEHFLGWHAAFILGGIPGLILGVVVFFILEPARQERPKSETSVVRQLLKIRAYRRACLGYIAQTFAVGGFALWAPTFLYIRFSIPLGKATLGFGVVTVAAGAIATMLGGILGDRAQAREAEREQQAASEPYQKTYATTPAVGAYRAPDPKRTAAGQPDTALGRRIELAQVYALLRVCAIGGMIAGPMTFLCFLSPGPALFFGCAFLGEIGIFLSNAPLNLVLLRAVPPHLRASAMAIAIMSIHLFGDLWSPAAIGKLADLVGNPRIQLAMLPLGFAFALSAVFWWVRPPKSSNEVPEAAQ